MEREMSVEELEERIKLCIEEIWYLINMLDQLIFLHKMARDEGEAAYIYRLIGKTSLRLRETQQRLRKFMQQLKLKSKDKKSDSKLSKLLEDAERTMKSIEEFQGANINAYPVLLPRVKQVKVEEVEPIEQEDIIEVGKDAGKKRLRDLPPKGPERCQ